MACLSSADNPALASTTGYFDPFAAVQTGTTIIAIKCAGGVVLGADSRTSAGGYIANRASRKISPITDRIMVCRSGSAADTQFLTQLVKRYINEHAMELGAADVPVSVRSAANLFKLVCYNNKDNLKAGVIIAGVDDIRGPQVSSITLGGSIIEADDYAFSGSGSTFVSGMLQTEYKHDMDPAQAVAFVQRVISRAMYNDASSGGLIRTVLITKDNVEETTVVPSEGMVMA